MSENIIEINNLCKSYKMYKSNRARLAEIMIPAINKHTDFKALDNLNLTLAKGEILGILGRNGAGKSTLLKLITGVATPTSGTIKINGKISSLLELGTAFNPELTGEENIYQHGQVMGLSKKEVDAKKQEIIEFADIGEHLGQPVKTYSSGMFARLAFACAINVSPDILIVDEVLSVGDMAFQLKCFKKFEDFKKSGKTILFVTHSINDVIRNCTRTIIMAKGKKIFDGDVKEGVELYKKMMVGIDVESELEAKAKQQEKQLANENQDNDNDADKPWKDSFSTTEQTITYGNGKAEIFDYGIFDSEGKKLYSLDNEKDITFKIKVKFNDKIENPIFAMSIKDFKGLELCGTNTEVNKVATGSFESGDIAIVEFKQRLPLEGNKYAVSFGCTKFMDSGDLEVFDRKYDALLIEISSNKPPLGLFEIDSEITVNK